MRKGKMPETMYRASRLCRVLGNPGAYLVLRRLGAGRWTPGGLAAALGVSRAAVSQTLRDLRLADLVRYETQGLNRWYWIKDRAVGKVLDALERLVETMRRKHF